MMQLLHAISTWIKVEESDWNLPQFVIKRNRVPLNQPWITEGNQLTCHILRLHSGWFSEHVLLEALAAMLAIEPGIHSLLMQMHAKQNICCYLQAHPEISCLYTSSIIEDWNSVPVFSIQRSLWCYLIDCTWQGVTSPTCLSGLESSSSAH